MNALERARNIVTQYKFKDLSKFGEDDAGFIDEKARGWYWDGDRSRMFYAMDAETLARSLHPILEIDETKIQDERKAKLGISKYKGLPHLPKSMKFPKGSYFVAQIACADVAKHDVESLFPKTGLLYFFMGPGDECHVVHWDGDPKELEVREYPQDKPQDAEYYLDGFLSSSARLTFSPRYVFYAGGGDVYDYSPSAKLIPKDLRKSLDAALPGFSLTERDSSLRLFGRPHYWQGEDEETRKTKPKPPKYALLLQDEFGEGTIHFWVDRKAAAKGDYSKCWMTYSGT